MENAAPIFVGAGIYIRPFEAKVFVGGRGAVHAPVFSMFAGACNAPLQKNKKGTKNRRGFRATFCSSLVICVDRSHDAFDQRR